MPRPEWLAGLMALVLSLGWLACTHEMPGGGVAPTREPTLAAVPTPTSAQAVKPVQPGGPPQSPTPSGSGQLEISPTDQPISTSQSAPVATLDSASLATVAAGEIPRHLTLEAARKEVPFPILMPTYLPKEFDPHSPEDFVMLLEGGPYGNEVKGVSITFRGERDPGDGFIPTLWLEQELGSAPAETEIPEAVKREADVGGYGATIWESRNIDGRPLVVVFWEDPDQGTWVNINGFVTVDEALRVLASLR